jgi:ElaB/YqjD/DUF883 family membrane-anchored ribosome-binding protein
MSRSTHEIERDVERTRSDIEDTVEALREKMSLGQIVDEAGHYFRHSGGTEALANLAAQAKANPMPLALVGIGLAWLMSGRGQPAMGSYTGAYRGSHQGSHLGSSEAYASGSYSGGGSSSLSNVGSRVGETAGSAKDAVAGAGRKAGEAMSSGVHKAGDAVSSGMHKAGDAASHTYERVSDKASETYGRMSEHASDTYDRMSERAGRAQRSMSELIESEPLILAGLGIAVGAAIGAMMPATRTEQRFMGDKLDEWKDEASDMARSEWEKTKSVAKRRLGGQGGSREGRQAWRHRRAGGKVGFADRRAVGTRQGPRQQRPQELRRSTVEVTSAAGATHRRRFHA